MPLKTPKKESVCSLETDKKKVISQIRSLLNDFPQMHPLANQFFLQSTFSLLKHVLLDLRSLDNKLKEEKGAMKQKAYEATLRRGIKIASAPLRALKKPYPIKLPSQPELEISM